MNVEPALRPFLQPTQICDFDSPSVKELALALRGERSQSEVARVCFEYVRDAIEHTADYGRDEITCSASEVLAAKTGFCYAKSHLLSALLRANGVPCGFVYQRLSLGEAQGYCLHGLNAVFLPAHGWVRVDPRGLRSDLRVATWDPPNDAVVYDARGAGERTFERIFAEPARVVLEALRRHRTREALMRSLPDASIEADLA